MKAEEERRKGEEDRLKASNTTAPAKKVQILNDLFFCDFIALEDGE